MRFLFLVLVLLAGPAFAALVPLAADRPIRVDADVEVLADPGGKLGIEQILGTTQAGRFTPRTAGGEINFGYVDAAYWLRVRVQTARVADWMLEIEYPSLDSVEVYAPDDTGHLIRQQAGDLQPFAQRPYPYHNLVFPLRLPGGESVIYLRVQSAGNLTVPMRIWSAARFYPHAADSNALYALYFGSLLALGLYNLLLFFSIRDRAYVEYFGFVLSMAVAQASQSGFANQYLWSEWPWWGNLALPAGFAATGLFGALFTRTFLHTAGISSWLDRLIRLFIGLFSLSAAVLPMSYKLGAMLVSLSGLGFSLLALVGGLIGLRRGHAGARYFLIAWSLLLSGVAVLALRNFAWLPTNFFTANAMLLGSSLEMLLLSFALADRINRVRQEKEHAQAETLHAKQAMVEALHRSEQELEARVEDRTRELAKANQLLSEREVALANLARRDPLTGLANRLALDEEVHRALHRADRTGQHVALLLIDLDRFKPINDQHGHEVGDAVLIQVAERIRQSTRANDMICRLGGDEFVVVLESEQADTDAGLVADKLIYSLQAPIEIGNLSVQVGASIGLSCCPIDGRNLRDLLHHADLAMYRAKAAAGGCYRLAGMESVAR